MKWQISGFTLSIFLLCLFSGCQNDNHRQKENRLPSFAVLSEDTLTLPERAVSMAFVSIKEAPDTSLHIHLEAAPTWINLEKLTNQMYRILVRAPRLSKGIYPVTLQIDYKKHHYAMPLTVHIERFLGHAYSLDGPKYWKEALKRAELGDMILLMDGDFGDLEISGKKAMSISISRAAGYDPKVRSLQIKGSTGIDIFGIDFIAEIPDSSSFYSRISIDEHSKNIGIHHCRFIVRQDSSIYSKGNQVEIYHNFIQGRKKSLRLKGQKNIAHDNLFQDSK